MSRKKTTDSADILIACCDGLKGFPESIEAVFPQAVVQTCIVQMIRNSLRFVSYKDRKAVAKELLPVYTAASREEAQVALDSFEQKWARRYPMIASSWRTNWERVVPFLDFPPDVRRVIYTTNAIESLNSTLRKLLQYRGHFPTDEAVHKLLYLALSKMEKEWERSICDWSAVLGQFSVFFKDRIRRSINEPSPPRAAIYTVRLTRPLDPRVAVHLLDLVERDVERARCVVSGLRSTFAVPCGEKVARELGFAYLTSPVTAARA
jgi:hypothetical protein